MTAQRLWSCKEGLQAKECGHLQKLRGRKQILPAGGGWGEAQEEPALPTPGLQPGENDSGLLTSRTVRKYICALLSH